MYIILFFGMAALAGGIYLITVAAAARRKGRKAVHSFNQAVQSLRSAQGSLDEYISKSNELLRAVKRADVKDPVLLEKFDSLLRSAQDLVRFSPPEMKKRREEIRAQARNIREQNRAAWRLYAELVDVFFLVEQIRRQIAGTGRLIVSLSAVASPAGSFPVYALHPETGEAALVSSFPISDGSYNSVQTPSALFLPAAAEPRREWYSADFSKLAATRICNRTGESHAGWIDTRGNFFDVTEALGFSSMASSRPPDRWHAAGFVGDIFGFYREEQGEKSYFYISTDSVSPLAVQRGNILAPSRPLPTGEDSGSRWNAVVSPNKERIAFMSLRPGAKVKTQENIDIYIAPADGEGPMRFDGYAAFVNGIGGRYFSNGDNDGLLYWTLIDWC